VSTGLLPAHRWSLAPADRWRPLATRAAPIRESQEDPEPLRRAQHAPPLADPDWLSDPAFQAVPWTDPGVREALACLQTQFDRCQGTPEGLGASLAWEGEVPVVRLELRLHGADAAEDSGPDLPWACLIRVEVAGDRIRAWHAREVSAPPESAAKRPAG
jgi:hypothetical protein